MGCVSSVNNSFDDQKSQATVTLKEGKVIWELNNSPADSSVPTRKYATLLKGTNQLLPPHTTNTVSLNRQKYSFYLGEWSTSTYSSNSKPVSSLYFIVRTISSSSISGGYCYHYSSGEEYSCLNEFKGSLIDNMQYLITFDNKKSQATLTFEEDKVIWALKSSQSYLDIPASNYITLLKGDHSLSNSAGSNTIDANKVQKTNDFDIQSIIGDRAVNSEPLSKYAQKDLSKLIQAQDKQIIGVMSGQYKRLKTTVDTLKRENSTTYLLTGHAQVANHEASEFSGSLVLDAIYEYDELSYGLDDEYQDKGLVKQGIAVFSYALREDLEQPSSGRFEGEMFVKFYETADGQIHYDDVDKHADSYFNRLYKGRWTAYNRWTTMKDNYSIIASWADYNLPDSIAPNLNIGAGEFVPNPDYYPYGWQDYAE